MHRGEGDAQVGLAIYRDTHPTKNRANKTIKKIIRLQIMNAVEKAQAQLVKLNEEWLEGKLTKEEFEQQASFLNPILEKAKEKARAEEPKRIANMSREEHMAYEKERRSHLEEQTRLHQGEVKEKSPEEVSDLVERIKSGQYQTLNEKIAKMSPEEHRKLEELLNQ